MTINAHTDVGIMEPYECSYILTAIVSISVCISFHVFIFFQHEDPVNNYSLKVFVYLNFLREKRAKQHSHSFTSEDFQTIYDGVDFWTNHHIVIFSVPFHATNG